MKEWDEHFLKSLLAETVSSPSPLTVLAGIADIDRRLRAKCFTPDDTPAVVTCNGYKLTGQARALGDHDVAVVWTGELDPGWSFAPPAPLPAGRMSTAGLVFALKTQPRATFAGRT